MKKHSGLKNIKHMVKQQKNMIQTKSMSKYKSWKILLPNHFSDLADIKHEQ